MENKNIYRAWNQIPVATVTFTYTFSQLYFSYIFTLHAIQSPVTADATPSVVSLPLEMHQLDKLSIINFS